MGMTTDPPGPDPYAGTPVVATETLRGIRRTIARRLGESWRQAVPVTLHRDLDATAAVAAAAPAGVSPLDLLLRAVVLALLDHPSFNATFDGAVIRQYAQVHLAIAVDTPRGLLAPVLRRADAGGAAALRAARRELAARVTDRRHTADDLVGGTFTVSQLGPLGVDHFTPVLNPPQVAILGVGRLQRRDVAWWPETEPQPRWLQPVSLTFDHRVNDGAGAARFLAALQQRLADPAALVAG